MEYPRGFASVRPVLPLFMFSRFDVPSTYSQDICTKRFDSNWQVANHVKLRSDRETAASMFSVDCGRARDSLAKKACHLGRSLCDQIMTVTSARNKILEWKYSTMETRVLRYFDEL